jgi:hypothetical protein
MIVSISNTSGHYRCRAAMEIGRLSGAGVDHGLSTRSAGSSTRPIAIVAVRQSPISNARTESAESDFVNVLLKSAPGLPRSIAGIVRRP